MPMFRSPAVWWRKRSPRFSIDPEVIAAIALLSAALAVSLSTVADYGLTVDEFMTWSRLAKPGLNGPAYQVLRDCASVIAILRASVVISSV